MTEAERRALYDLAMAGYDADGHNNLDKMIERGGLTFQYRIVSSLGSTLHGGGPYAALERAEWALNQEMLYIDSLRNTAPEFRQARIAALRIERRLVGRWETP